MSTVCVAPLRNVLRAADRPLTCFAPELFQAAVDAIRDCQLQRCELLVIQAELDEHILGVRLSEGKHDIVVVHFGGLE